MCPHRHVRLAVTFSLFLAVVQVAAEKPLLSSTSVRPDPNLDRAELPEINLLRTRISRDPVTGQLVIAPGSGRRDWTLSPREQNMLSRSDEGLKPTVLANGAVAVHLRGRFQSLATAYSEPGINQLKMSCSVIDAAPLPDKQPPGTRPDVHPDVH
jgi:hypothetical protein